MVQIKKLLFGLSMLLLLGAGNLAIAADDSTQIGRYLNAPNIPLTSQANLLAQTFQVHFPASVKTIGDAMRYLLQFSGYSLVERNNLIPEAKHLMELPLPQADRNLGPLSLKDGLLTLAGNPFGLLVDPVHRLISFRLLPQYKTLYQKPNSFIF